MMPIVSAQAQTRHPEPSDNRERSTGFTPGVINFSCVDWYARQEITPRQEALLTTTMHMLVPNLKPASVRAACCIIEKTPSRYPYLGHIDDDESLTVAVGGNGHGARGSDEIGRLAATIVLGRPWDCAILPQTMFTPMAADADTGGDAERPAFLKPPFGLC
jgi:sarcosine oxidase